MSIKLGNLTINKIYLGTAAINKVYLGSALIFPTAVAPETLIEGYEIAPYTSTLEWFDDGGNLTTTRTSSNVTQGSFTWRLQSLNSFLLGSGPAWSFPAVDLSAYTTLKINYFAASVPLTGTLQLTVADAAFTDQIDIVSAADPSGAITLTLDLTTATFDLSETNIALISNGVGTWDVYADNLRAS